ARLTAVTVAAEVGRPDDDLAARRPERDVASALILDRVTRPLSQGAGLAPVLRVVESDLRRLGHQEGRQSVGQCRDRALQGLEVFGGADHAPIAAFGFDLLLDVLDLGPDLREAIPRLLWGLLWMSPLAGFALGHGRSPCDGSVGKRRLSTGVWEKRNPAPRHRFFRIAPAYGVFAAEARDVDPEYAPQTVNTDGWASTRNAFQTLFPLITVVLCFLHGFLKIRDRCRKACELHRRVWDVYRAATAEEFR